MLVNPLKPDVFNYPDAFFGLFIRMCLGRFKWFGLEAYAIAYRFHLLFTSKFYESVLYTCLSSKPNLAFGK